jgi:hypothetical protein
VAPPPPVIDIPFDVKPTSCRNPVNIKSKGVLPTAILGTEEFDVTQVDPGTVYLLAAPDADPMTEGVAPLRWAYEDVAKPYEPFVDKPLDPFACTEEGADGWLDLTIKFEQQEVVAAFGDVDDGDVIKLYITGKLKEAFGGSSIRGEDVIVVLNKGKK